MKSVREKGLLYLAVFGENLNFLKETESTVLFESVDWMG